MIKLKFINYFKQQILILICCFSFLGYSNDLRLSDNAQISVLTCGSGDEMYSIFGHTAIRVLDPINNVDVVYNYGLFDFNTPDFYAKFIKGDLLYSVGEENYEMFLDSYKYFNRSVTEQFLQLTVAQKQQIYDRIQQQINSSERYYKYQFIDNNCTTKVVDLINPILEKPLNTNFDGNTESKRNILNSFLTKNYFEKLGINILFGKKVDELNDKIFLPEKLMHSIMYSNNGMQKLEQNNILHFDKIAKESQTNWNNIYFFSIICLILAFLSPMKSMQIVFFFFIGILGSLILIVSLYTSHQELIWNESLLLFNPFYFLLIFLKKKRFLIKVMFLFVCIFVIIASLTKILILLPLLLLQIVFLYQISKIKSP